MYLKFRMQVMEFSQFFIWACWLLTLGAYWFQTKHWSGAQFGAIFSTMGIASLFMPGLIGVIADKWVNAEKLYGFCHLVCSGILFSIPWINNPETFFWVMLVNMLFYMPTIALGVSIFYSVMTASKMDIIREYPSIRVFGTFGFIAGLWLVSLLNLETSAKQFYIASLGSLFLGCYAFTMPKCPPLGNKPKQTFIQYLCLDALVLLKDKQIFIFFMFAILFGATMQLTNGYADTYLHDFGKINYFKDTLAVKHPAIIISVSQFSEIIFILLIPIFLKQFKLRNVMMICLLAWVFRFGFLAFGNPGNRLWMIVSSCVIYGMAFNFSIIGSLFLQSRVSPGMRASGQGLYMIMTNGLGAILGSRVSAWMIENYYTINGQFDWRGIWLSFAFYSLLVSSLFVLLFKEKDSDGAMHSLR